MKLIKLILLLLLIATPATAQAPQTFSSFWRTFKAAIARNDKQAVADITKLPFLFDSKDRDREGFVKIYPELFTRKIRRCVATAKPVKEAENYEIFCGDLILYFGKDTDGKYKFLEFGVND